jgi:SAM-dependent MidA family methyltransferase
VAARMNCSQPLNSSTSQLVASIRDEIQERGPISFARFMEQALYHPVHGYYGSGRCAIGRRGDYFTNVSVGPLFGTMLAGQFAEIWRALGRPRNFVIVEQGAHHGEFATDVLEALHGESPRLFATLRYRIVEPFSILRQRQQRVLRPFAGKTEWCVSPEGMEPFCGVHFSNELIDAMPVHLLVGCGAPEQREWHECLVDQTSCGLTLLHRPITDARLRVEVAKLPSPPRGPYETEIGLAGLDWIEALAPKLERGVVLVSDYGFPRRDYYALGRNAGTLQCYSAHRVLSSPLEEVGENDITAHVDWTNLAKRAEKCGLHLAGFTDQHHFLTGLLSSYPDLASAGMQKSRALQTLLHPELLGTKFQFLALTKKFPATESLGGFKFARNSRKTLGLE